jgi:hypothetical protein
MNTKQESKAFPIAASIVILVLIFGMMELLRLRFSAGDVYPYYSSLRADPLGSKALYESFEVCCDLKVSRNYEPFARIQNRSDAAVLVLGFQHDLLHEIPRDIADQIHYFISSGGRLVITFLPPKKQGLGSLPQAEDSFHRSDDLFEKWGLRIFKEKQRAGAAFLTAEFTRTNLPPSIAVHTSLYFQTVDPDWKTIYQRNQHPVLIERNFGHGSLVLSTESYFVSNEALARERQPELLLWLIGDHKSILFDEYHHGISADAGVMVLARRYHLEWLLAGFLLIGILFIWKSAAPLVQPEPEPDTPLQTGKESTAGLTNLLRRNVPASQLLNVCFQEWQKSLKDISPEKIKQMEAIVQVENAKPARQRDLPAAYNALNRTLKERK